MYILCSRIYTLFVPLQKPWKDCSVHTHCLYSTVQTFNHHRIITSAIRRHHSHGGSMAGLYWQLWDVLRFRWVIYLLRSVLEGAAWVFRIQSFWASPIRIRNYLHVPESRFWSGQKPKLYCSATLNIRFIDMGNIECKVLTKLSMTLYTNLTDMFCIYRPIWVTSYNMKLGRVFFSCCFHV